MDMRRRWDLAAAACLAIVAVLLLGSTVALLVAFLPDLLSEDEHLAGDASMVVSFLLVPLATAGVVTLVPALLLGLGAPGGRSLALLWSILAGLAVAAICWITGGYLATPFSWIVPIVALGAVMVAYLLLRGPTVGRGHGQHPQT